MGRELQKKKNRSSTPKARLKPKTKKVFVKGNATIRQNWNQSLTLVQNYRRLGLVARLKNRTGGTEKASPTRKDISTDSTKAADSLSITRNSASILDLPLARIERDPVTGANRVVRTGDEIDNPLNDPLNPITEAENTTPAGSGVDHDIIKELEEQAKLEAKKRPRQQSERENEWLARLIAKYGEDYGSMVRDTKLNRYQQTEGDIRRRIKRWKAKQSN